MSKTLNLPVLNYAPWSVSKASLAGQCSKAFDFRYVQKLKGEPAGTESKIGTVAHRAQELVLQDVPVRKAIKQALKEDDTLTHSEANTVRSFEANYVKFKSRIETLKSNHPFKEFHTEKKLAINANFEPCDYDSPDCLIRGNVDVLIVTESGHIIVFDHKTGKRKDIEKHQTQLDTYLVMAAAHFPDSKGLQAAIHYVAYNAEVDWDKPRSRKYATEKLHPWLLSYLSKQSDNLEQVRASITPLCGWCNFRNSCDEWLAHGEKKSKAKLP